jgi:hypothetical protein
METFALNRLAESFEVDRSTMVRAMRNVPPDLVKPGNRPTWKTSTAARALERHRRNNDGGASGVSGQIDPQLAALYARFDDADAALRKLKTVDARRKAAVEIAPIIAKMDALARKVGLANGNDPELVDLRADKLFLLYLRGFEAPCGWSMDETWAAMDVRE